MLNDHDAGWLRNLCDREVSFKIPLNIIKNPSAIKAGGFFFSTQSDYFAANTSVENPSFILSSTLSLIILSPRFLKNFPEP